MYHPHEYSISFPTYNPNQPHYRQSMDATDSPQPASPSPSHPLLNFGPNSRSEAIVRGQWELMEMVRNMPESSYELSLKDIVEYHRSPELSRDHEQEVDDDSSMDLNHSLHHRTVKIRTEDHQLSRKIDRNLILENKGLFLNMVFPFSLKSKKKMNRVSGNSNSGVKASKNEGERDWWKRKFTGSSDSDSSRTSNNSGSSTVTSGGAASTSSGSEFAGAGGRRRNGFLCGCWPFFQSRSNKSGNWRVKM